MRRRKPWVLARRRLFGWKVRLLTRRLLAFGTSGFRWNRYSSTCRNSMLGHCCCARDDGLRQWLLSNVGGCGRSVWWTPHRAHPDRNRSPSGRTVNYLDAGTQHRAVGDSTEPRYGALAGAVKPAPPPALACRGRRDHCASPVCGQLLVDNRRTSTAQFGGRTPTTGARHTKTTRPTRQKMCCALWTTACCAAHRVSSVARRRATSPPEPCTVRLPL